jgi:hypothetical protein
MLAAERLLRVLGQQPQQRELSCRHWHRHTLAPHLVRRRGVKVGGRSRITLSSSVQWAFIIPPPVC